MTEQTNQVTFFAIVDNSTAASPPELPIPMTTTVWFLNSSAFLNECVWITFPKKRI